MSAERLALVVATLAIPSAAYAQATIRGLVVTDASASPIAGAIVEIPEIHKSVTTDAQGAFLITGLRSWRYKLDARKLGFLTDDHEVDVLDRDTARVLFRLRPAVAELAPVTVSEANPEAYINANTGFNDRRKVGIGTFLVNAELRRQDASTLQELVVRLGMSVKLTTCRNGQDCPPGRPYAAGKRGPSSFRSTVCPVQVFIDGVPYLAAGMPFDLSTLKVQDLGALEYYAGASQTPLIFEKGTSMCGVLVLWTATRQP